MFKTVKETFAAIRKALKTRKAFVIMSVPIVLVLMVASVWGGVQNGLSDFWGALGGFFDGPVYMALLLYGFYIFDKYELPDTDFVEEIFVNENVAAAIVVAALLIAWAIVCQPGLAQQQSHNLPHVADTAQTYIGVTEHPPNSNKGETVEQCLASVDLGPGYPYCAACASMWLDAAQVKGPIGTRQPFYNKQIRSALSAHFMGARQFIPAQKVRTGQVDVIPIGSIGIYLKGNTIHGHTVIVTGDDIYEGGWQGVCGTTVEANTTPSDDAPAAQQREGGGVWPRTRCIEPNAYFRLVGFAVPRV